MNHYLIGVVPIPKDTETVFEDTDGAALAELYGMLDEFSSKLPGYVQMIRSGLIRIIIRAMRRIQALERIGDAKIRRMTEYAQENFAEKDPLAKVSRLLGYFESYLSLLFKNSLGVTYSEFLLETRIRVSCQLLENTELSIEEIAESTGYADVRFFRRNFIKIMNLTPLKYRKALLKKGVHA